MEGGRWLVYLHPLISPLSTQTADCRLETELQRTQHPHYHHHLPIPAASWQPIYTAVQRQRRVEAEHQSFELIPLILSAQLMDMVQLSTARSFNIFWGFPIIRVVEEKYGAMCRHGMQRRGIASMSAESVLWAAWDCCLLYQLHTC